MPRIPSAAPFYPTRHALIGGLVPALLFSAALALLAQVHGPAKTLTGTVTGSDNHPVPKVHVLLQSTPASAVRSYITDAEGHYRFTRLDSHTDYKVWARYKGHDSASARISKFDANPNPTADLKLPTP